MNFHVVLFEGTDTIKFGLSHEEIRAIMGKSQNYSKLRKYRTKVLMVCSLINTALVG